LLNPSDEINQVAALRVGSRPLLFVSLYIFWVPGTADSMGMGPGKIFLKHDSGCHVGFWVFPLSYQSTTQQIR